MKITNIFALLLLSLTATTNVLAQTDGKELFIQKCASCHMLEFPEKRTALKAAPVGGIMFQLNHNIADDEKMLAYIKDFVMNPSQEKIIFNRIRKFGAMPSQKGKLTEDELSIIAEWMVDEVSISRKDYKDAKHRMKRSSAKEK